jgi:hypothetical protein
MTTELNKRPGPEWAGRATEKKSMVFFMNAVPQLRQSGAGL